MRHILTISALALALAACDDSTTAPTDTIPGPPNAPRLTLTVLTGTKVAPVDSPTVKVEWAYADSVIMSAVVAPSNGFSAKYLSYNRTARAGIGAVDLSAGCNGIDTAKIYFSISDYQLRSSIHEDSVVVHCK